MQRRPVGSALSCRSRSPEATRAAGARLAGALGDGGGVVALCGPLGAGKTVFVKGLAEGMGIDPARVSSPTFVIASEHPAGARRLVHVDLYRVESEPELESAGWRDWLAPDCVVAVEWADRLPGALPEDHLEVALQRGETGAGEGQGARVLRATAGGERARAVLARFGDALARAAEDPAAGLEDVAWR